MSSGTDLRWWIEPVFSWRRNLICRVFHALREVAITIALTFLPVAFAASLPWTETDWGSGKFAARFLDYWANGELALPILAMCGAISAILFSRQAPVAGVSLVLLGLLCGLGMGESDGFSKDLDSTILRVGFWIYVGLAVIWIWLIAAHKTPEPGLRSEKSSKILDEARRRKAEQEQS